jgi:LAGLIDADG endonuclease/NADH-ubiquinone/plastoquinone oxidoreductase, chain 3
LFSPVGQARSKFSIQFFLVALLFLTFDIEILFLYPIAVSLNGISELGFWILILFLAILIIGFVYEYSLGVLNFVDKSSRSRATKNSPPITSFSSYSINPSLKSFANQSIRSFSTNNSPPTEVKPIKIYSNADIQKLDIIKENKGKSGISTSNSIKMDPYFVTGFSDAESCFSIFIRRSSTNKLGWQVEAIFAITLNSKDLPLLYLIQFFFGGIGRIKICSTRNVVSFVVTKLEDLVNVIIPHFQKYPLQSAKSIDFQLWVDCIELMVKKNHLKEDGLKQIISIRGAINRGLSDKLKEAFPYVTSMERPTFEISEVPLDPNWISGFSEGDSSFIITIRSNSTHKQGWGVEAIYSIELNEREYPLLMKIQSFFNGVGNINEDRSNRAKSFRVSRRVDLTSIIIPHFNSFPLVGNKLSNYVIWSDIVSLMQSKVHLTPEGLAFITNLKNQLNK